MKTDEEWIELETRMINLFERNGWKPFGKFARNSDGTLKRMYDGMPVAQSILDLFDECEAQRAKLIEEGINPYDEI